MKKNLQKASVDLHTAIYKEAAVRTAAREYAAFAAFSFAKKGSYLRVTVTPLDGPLPANFMEEFANMAILNSI